MRALVLLPFAILPLGCDINRQLGNDLPVQPVAPLAGAGTGNAHSGAAGQPTLRWKANSQAQTYHLQVDDSCGADATCDFPSPEIDEAALAATSYVPASPLPASSAAPFSRRYYWRVQACSGNACGEWSLTRSFVVGQDLTLNRDINGDGYPDFVVGAPNSSQVKERGGQALVFLGGPTLPFRPALVLNGEVPGDQLGYAVAMAGDVNGDGYGDYLVRAVGVSDVGPQNGRIMLFFGGPNLKSQPDIVFPAQGMDLDGATSGSVAGCGDLNGDGYDDIAFNAFDVAADGTLILPDRVEIHFGGPDMASSAPLVLYGESPPPASSSDPFIDYDGFGSSISQAGDVNGDGYPDLIVGARTLPSADSLTVGGKVRIYLGGPGMDAAPDVVLEMAKVSNPGLDSVLFGASVAGLGDVNGDGFADVAVGAPGFDINYRSAPSISRVYVYFGGSASHTSPDLVLQGDQGTEEFGTWVVPAGDVNHDGYADFAVLAPGIGPATLVGTPDAIPLWPGKAYLYSGGQNAGQSLIATVEARTAFPHMPSLAVLDIDGDAYPEILSGQCEQGPDTCRSGQVSIYRSSDNYAQPARTIPGTSSGNAFGLAMSP